MIGIGFALFFTFANPFTAGTDALNQCRLAAGQETIVNINLTLIVQMLVFIVLIWFTMKFVWPMILGPDGRALAQDRHGARRRRARAKQDLAEAESAPKEIIREARDRAAQIVDMARQALERNRRGSQGHGLERSAASGGAGPW